MTRKPMPKLLTILVLIYSFTSYSLMKLIYERAGHMVTQVLVMYVINFIIAIAVMAVAYDHASAVTGAKK